MSIESLPTLIRFLQVLGILVSTLKAGHGLGESFCTIPWVVLGVPTGRSTTLTQWRKVYQSGFSSAVPSIITGTLSFAMVAYSMYKRNNFLWTYYAFSSVLVFGMIPATLFLLMPVIHVLEAEEAKSEKARNMSEEQIKILVKSWASRNVLRQMLPLSASIIALYGTLVIA